MTFDLGSQIEVKATGMTGVIKAIFHHSQSVIEYQVLTHDNQTLWLKGQEIKPLQYANKA